MDKEEKDHRRSQQELFRLVLDFFDGFKRGVMQGEGNVTPETLKDAQRLKEMVEQYVERQDELNALAGFDKDKLEELKENPSQLNLSNRQQKLWDQIEEMKDMVEWHRKWVEAEQRADKEDERKSRPKKRRKRFRGLGGRDDWMPL